MQAYRRLGSYISVASPTFDSCSVSDTVMYDICSSSWLITAILADS